jgi:PIN domain nuclease of toxin-antitoxin system
MIIEKGRVSLTKPRLSKITTQWHTSDNIRLTSLSPQLVIDSMGLTEMPDIFDRLLVAEARQLDVAVITQDPIIVDSGLVRVIW